jgi:predicted peroxiredoxin
MRAPPSRALVALTLVAVALAPGAAAHAQRSAPTAPAAPAAMSPRSLLIHITAGPNDPTRAALGFNVAKAAVDEGHRVTIFLAGDGVQLLRDGVLASLVGLGTGTLKELYDGFVAKGGRLVVSGGSAKARGVTEADLAGKPAEFGGPPQLVKLALEHDRVITY